MASITNISTDLLGQEYKWSAPSNIALVKYWGKKSGQIPCNPSLSITLDKSVTTTSVKLLKREDEWIKFYLDGKLVPAFIPKITTFFERLGSEWSFLRDYSLEISSSNTFPHSSGMASSASAMSALALCLLEMKNGHEGEDFLLKASAMARLGSGSACRSLYGKMALWGEDGEGGHDEYAIAFNDFHPYYQNIQDTVLIVSSGEKAVSSTKGHELLNDNPYAQPRYQQARDNLIKLKDVLKTDHFETFAQIVENEALSLHAMMMTSNPGYILMKPATLKIIEKVVSARKAGLKICFTLDAGPNIHLLYPSVEKEQVLSFIESELVDLCENGNYIKDEMGTGPTRLTKV